MGTNLPGRTGKRPPPPPPPSGAIQENIERAGNEEDLQESLEFIAKNISITDEMLYLLNTQEGFDKLKGWMDRLSQVTEKDDVESEVKQLLEELGDEELRKELSNFYLLNKKTLLELEKQEQEQEAQERAPWKSPFEKLITDFLKSRRFFSGDVVSTGVKALVQKHFKEEAESVIALLASLKEAFDARFPNEKYSNISSYEDLNDKFDKSDELINFRNVYVAEHPELKKVLARFPIEGLEQEIERVGVPLKANIGETQANALAKLEARFSEVSALDERAVRPSSMPPKLEELEGIWEARNKSAIKAQQKDAPATFDVHERAKKSQEEQEKLDLADVVWRQQQKIGVLTKLFASGSSATPQDLETDLSGIKFPQGTSVEAKEARESRELLAKQKNLGEQDVQNTEKIKILIKQLEGDTPAKILQQLYNKNKDYLKKYGGKFDLENTGKPEKEAHRGFWVRANTKNKLKHADYRQTTLEGLITYLNELHSEGKIPTDQEGLNKLNKYLSEELKHIIDKALKDDAKDQGLFSSQGEVYKMLTETKAALDALEPPSATKKLQNK